MKETLAIGMFAQDVLEPEEAVKRWNALPHEVRERWRERALKLFHHLRPSRSTQRPRVFAGLEETSYERARERR